MANLLAAPLSPESWPRPLRLAGLGLAWLALAVYFHTPVREAMQPNLDGSNYGSYAYFTAHHFQYGTAVVPMAGPYGFIMYGWTYSGELFGLRTAGELLLNGILAALSLWFFRHWRGSAMRWAWLAAHLAFSSFIEDLPLEWILLLGGFYLLQAAPGPRISGRAALVAGALALVSLIKGTQLILGLATLVVVAGAYAGQRRWREAGRLAAAYALALLGFWLLAGQNPLHLPVYLRGMLELGGGYTGAMGIPTPPAIFCRSLLVSGGLAAGLGVALWQRRHDLFRCALLLLLAGHAFVQWKHSVVRSDGHAYIYFHFAIVAALTTYLAGSAPATTVPNRLQAGWRMGCLLATLVLASFGGDEPMLPNWDGAPAAIAGRLQGNARHLLHLAAVHADLERALEAQRRAHLLPQVREKVGRRTIDAFGFEQGLLPLNDLNYRPRPMGGGSFNVYTPWLMARNRHFLENDARRPDFYLLKLQTVDERLGTQDDGPALVELLARYRPVLIEHEHFLMEAIPSAPVATPRPVGRWTGKFGETAEIPAVGDGELLLARFDVRENLTGRVRALLYKPAPVFIDLVDSDGATRHRRLVPAMARVPFLLAPELESPDDLVSLYDRGAGRAPRQLRVTTAAPGGFAVTVSVEFLAVPRPPRLAATALAELRGRVRFPYANVVPATITPAFRPHHSVRFLHPPAEAVWPLAGDERAIDFHFGIDAEAYERGTTNGVDFIVELRAPSGGVKPVFRRALKPRSQPADGGDQSAHVPLPIFAAGSSLVLRTDPGEFGDNAWDWAYVSRIELKRGGPYAAELFPGFSRVPDFADDENAGVVDFDGAHVLLLHVPGRLGFHLTGGERRLALSFGFLPGAYQNGGQTQGADYIVEVARAGQPPRELFRRQLRPARDAADRAPQAATIDLGGLTAEDVLTVRTAPIPGGTNSWGWTYLSRLVIE